MKKPVLVIISTVAAIGLCVMFIVVDSRRNSDAATEKTMKQPPEAAPKAVEAGKAAPAKAEVVKADRPQARDKVQKPGKRVKKTMTPEEKKAFKDSHGSFSSLKSADEKIEVLETYADFNDPGVTEVVNKALDDKDPDVRLRAVEILSEMASDVVPKNELVALLDKAFLDDKANIRLAAVEALTQLELKGAHDILAKAIEDKSEDVRGAAFDALDYQEAEGKNMVLEKAVGSPFRDVRSNVVSNITMNANHDGVSILIEGLKSEDNEFKKEVVETLEFLIDQKFSSHDEAKKWWEGNKHRYDEDLFEKSEKEEAGASKTAKN